MGLLGRQPGIVAFTVAEVAGLAGWLAIVRDMVVVEVTVAGTAIPAEAVGLGVLFVGLLVEHVLTDATVNGVRPRNLSPTAVFVSATETALWAVWLVVAEAIGGLAGVAVAGVVLAVLLVPQHTVEDNGLRGRGLFSQLVNHGTLRFSVVEALGASVWLALLVDGSLLEAAGVAADLDPALVGAGALAAFLFVEHNVGVRFSLRPTERRADRREPVVAR